MVLVVVVVVVVIVVMVVKIFSSTVYSDIYRSDAELLIEMPMKIFILIVLIIRKSSRSNWTIS